MTEETGNVNDQLWRMRKRLAVATLIAAALVTPTLWLAAGSLAGDFLAGVWLGTLAAFVMVAGPIAAPDKPLVSRFLVIGGVMFVGGPILLLSPVGDDTSGGNGALIAFVIGALLAHASWASQINRVNRRIVGEQQE